MKGEGRKERKRRGDPTKFGNRSTPMTGVLSRVTKSHFGLSRPPAVEGS